MTLHSCLVRAAPTCFLRPAPLHKVRMHRAKDEQWEVARKRSQTACRFRDHFALLAQIMEWSTSVAPATYFKRRCCRQSVNVRLGRVLIGPAISIIERHMLD
jgi:hypothetical protein